MRIFLPFFIFAVFILAPAHAFTLSSFDSPESMAMDPEEGSYYVSNVNGDVSEKDGNGYISKIHSNGNIVVQKFIGGTPNEIFLNAPKGLVVVGANIFVTDIDSVKAFDKVTRKPSLIIDLAPHNALFLNDIAADSSGTLYVSDMMGNQIFKIDPRKNYEVSLFKKSDDLAMPNGLVVNPKSRNLMVLTWESGRILEINGDGKIHVLKRGLSHLDGMDYDARGDLYVSSFKTGEIYRIPNYGRGTLSTYLNGLTTPADIACDRRTGNLLIPSLEGNKVEIHPRAS